MCDFADKYDSAIIIEDEEDLKHRSMSINPEIKLDHFI